MTGGKLRQAIDKAGQFDEPDTITREHYRRLHGNGNTPAPPVVTACLECTKPLRPVQIKNGGRFCCHRCAGRFNARKEYGPTGKAPRAAEKEEEAAPVGIVHDLIGDEFDVTTGERNGWRPPPAPDPACNPLTDLLLDLVGQALDSADSWRFEARLGDIALTLSRETR